MFVNITSDSDGWQTPPPICDFAQWLDTEQSAMDKWWVEKQFEWREQRRRQVQREKEEEEKRKKFQEEFRTRCERIDREKEAEREHKRARVRRAKEAMEQNPDALRKGKWPHCTQ